MRMNKMLKSLCTLLLVAVASAVPGSAQAGAVRYHLDPAQRAHHELEVTVEFTQVDQPVLEVRMSRSSPGRYALHEFAKNVYSVSATDDEGRPLPIERADQHRWNVTTQGNRRVIFRYTLFADRVDGTYSAVDRSHMHLNAPATFAWARGFEQRPALVSIDLPEGWHVATQLESTQDSATFMAADLQALMDAPIEASALWLREWSVPGSSTSASQSQTVRVALHHEGSDEEAEVYTELAAAIVDEQIAVFRDVPAFDHGTYTFLADYLPWASGDGMEHRNSTVLSSSQSLDQSMERLLGTVSHEFFHAWNIERIRPQTLEPFDFTRANMTGELWFGEGFTSYYDDLVLKRVGVMSFEKYVAGMSRGLAGFLAAPGRQYRSPEQMSHQAAFVDAASWIDRTNGTNNFISYYTYGAMLGLALDLELRGRFDVELDEFMRVVWRRHGVVERPYTREDLISALAEVSNQEFASDFFSRFVAGSETPDYARLLEPAGLLLQKAHPGVGWVGGNSIREHDDGLTIARATRVTTPLYAAGLDIGDVILLVDGELVNDPDAFEQLVEAAEISSKIELRVRSRGEEFALEVRVAENPALEVRTFEQEGRTVTDAIRNFRGAWLDKKGERSLSARKHCSEGGLEFDYAVEFCPWHGTALEPTLAESERQ